MQGLIPTPTSDFQKYDWSQSYEWNYANAPAIPSEFVSTEKEKNWTLCGVKVASPVAVAAGPLLNGRWLLHYAALGFDVLTYKTVRSRSWPCYAPPNLQPIQSVIVSESPVEPLPASDAFSESWAVSFGMPSQPPEVWRADLEYTRSLLPSEKTLAVSVVATPAHKSSVDMIARDYAQCAVWAADSGADMIELNFSCPNVVTSDGQLYQDPISAAIVASETRARIGNRPLLVKLGQIRLRDRAEQIISQLAPIVDGLVMINCIPAQVAHQGELLFDGQKRGIAGPAIGAAVVKQSEMFLELKQQLDADVEIIAVGGISTDKQVKSLLELGVGGIQLATAVMA